MGRLVIVSDILSNDPHVALSALKLLGYTLHGNSKRVDHVSGNDASTMLLSLCQLITSTNNEELCGIAIWCLEGKGLATQLRKFHIHLILEALVHAIDNPMNSKSISQKAMEVLGKTLLEVPVTDTSSLWAPAVYRKLLSTDQEDCDAAEKCLKHLESVLLPPSSSLSQVVVTDINETLLPKMEKMVKTRTLMLNTIRAWGWLVKLLGGLAGQHKILLNQLLKILEITFMSNDEFVKLASLVAWESLIDALLQPSIISGMDNTSITPPSFGYEKPYLRPSLQRIKLLMMPIETIIRNERDEVVRQACWRTWAYFAHKIGPVINQPSITTVLVAPIFTEIFKRGPDKGNPSLWDLCLNALEDWVSCKLRDKLDSGMLRVVSDVDREDRIASPNTPTYHVPGLISASNLSIDWAPWSPDSLNLILQLVKALWDFGIKGLHLKEPYLGNLSLNGALRLFVLVVKGVEDDGKASIQPSKQHVDSVHSLLRFVSGIAFDCELEANKKDLISAVWAAVEKLTELKSLVLSSTFYKIALSHLIKQGESSESCKEQCSGTEKQEIVQNGSCDVTPIVFILGIWLRFGYRVMNEEGSDKFLERVKRLSVLAISGLGTMGNLFGISRVLNWLLHLNSNKVVREFMDQADKKQVTVAQRGFDKSSYLMCIWKVFAEQITNHLESANVVSAIEGGVGDSGYQVIQDLLLFPIQIHIQEFSLGKINEVERSKDCMGTSNSQDSIDPLLTSWFKLFNCVSHIPSLISSQPNFFSSSLCQRLLMLLDEPIHREREGNHAFREIILLIEMLGCITENVLKQTEISTIEMLAASRTKRLGCLSRLFHGALGCEIDDRSNIRHILSLVSRLTDMSCDEILAKKRYWLGPASRMLKELATFIKRLHSQQDVLIFLQCFSNSFAKWIRASYASLCSGQETDMRPRRLKVSLEQAWEGHLAGLERHIPLHNFNSNLLLIQSSALLAAFQHPHASIFRPTLSFWEVTYGRRMASLEYPPCLLPILTKLKSRVNISLPGWRREVTKDLGSFSGYVGLPYRGKRWRQMFQQQLSDINDVPQCKDTLAGSKSELGDIDKASNLKAAASGTPVSANMESGANNLEVQTLSVDSSLNDLSHLPQALVINTSLSNLSPVPGTLSIDASLTSFPRLPQTVECMSREVETCGEFSHDLVELAANYASAFRVENEAGMNAVTSCSTKAGNETAISEPGSEGARKKKVKFLNDVRDTSHCASISKAEVVELVGEIPDASFHNNSKQSLDAKEEETRREINITQKRILKRCKNVVPHEVRKLGIKRQRFLRSSGCLRGGKFRRDTLATVKKSEKILIKPCTDATAGSTKMGGSVEQCRKRGRPRKMQWLEEDKTTNAKKECGKQGQPLETMVSCGEVNTSAIVVSPGMVDHIIDGHGLSQWMQMSCDRGGSLIDGDELIRMQDTVLSSPPLPFRVQALNHGILGEAVNSRSSGQLKASIVSNRPHRRKSSFPKKIPFFQINEPLVQEEYNKKVKAVKDEGLELKGSSLSPSKKLRSGRKLKPPVYNPTLQVNVKPPPIEESVQQESKTDMCHSNSKEDHKGSSSCMASMHGLGNENNGVIETHYDGCSSLALSEQLDTLAPKWRICDLLAAICSSPEWRAMKYEDLACAQKHMWSIMGIISENKEKLLNKHYYQMS